MTAIRATGGPKVRQGSSLPGAAPADFRGIGAGLDECEGIALHRHHGAADFLRVEAAGGKAAGLDSRRGQGLDNARPGEVGGGIGEIEDLGGLVPQSRVGFFGVEGFGGNLDEREEFFLADLVGEVEPHLFNRPA